MKSYLIFCHYESYCQGWENSYGYFLVHKARNFNDACDKLKYWFSKQVEVQNPRDFTNNTVE